MPVSTTIHNHAGTVKGDINWDGEIDLTDAVIALKVLVGSDVSSMIVLDYGLSNSDANGDDMIGLSEILYIMQKIAELR